MLCHLILLASCVVPLANAAAAESAGSEYAERVTTGQESAPPNADQDAAAEPPKRKDEGDHSVTHASVQLGGSVLSYTARAGTLPLSEENGKRKASIFFVAYTADGVEDPRERPVTFAFNGGPGSSSVWLHMGALGPRRVALESDGAAPPPPYAVVENPQTWLTFTDLVFIDPVTTGYSRAADGEDLGQFHGVDEDAKWVAEFIRLWTTRTQRWASPKFLAGESYGTTRAAVLSDELQEQHGMYLNGIVLISSILDFRTARFDVGNDLPCALFLPTYTATAWFHKQLAAPLDADLARALAESEAFAAGPYLTALTRGDGLDARERERVRAELARLTGLSEDFIERANLRIESDRFCKELMRSERRTVGRLDSRFLGIDRDAAGENYEYDPSYSVILGPFTAAINDYVRRTLNYESDLPYEILTGRVQPWKMGDRNRYLNVAERLRSAMTRNPALRVFVAAGLYDFATPYFAAQWTFDHMQLDPSLAEHVSMARYPAGHMMYIQDESRASLARDVGEFYRACLAR